VKPLNGTKTHPLSRHALDELRNLANEPLPRSAVNPGVVDRLTRENLVRIVQKPSPFKVHRGGDCDYLEITDAGRERLMHN
jgi:hypothetical protein